MNSALDSYLNEYDYLFKCETCNNNIKNVEFNNICCGAFYLKSSLYNSLNDDIINLVYDYVEKQIITTNKAPKLSLIHRFNINRVTKHNYNLTIDTNYIKDKFFVSDQSPNYSENIEQHSGNILSAMVSLCNNALITHNGKRCLKIISHLGSSKFDIKYNSGETICTVKFSYYNEKSGPRRYIIKYDGKEYENHRPEWSNRYNAHIVLFNENRVKEKSVKNFKIINDDKVLLQFGKKDRNNFIMDISHVFPLELAFAISLCTFMTKI